MEKYPAWMEEYLFDISQCTKEHTISVWYLINDEGSQKRIDMGQKSHLTPHAYAWEQIDKQFELLEKYFNIYSFNRRTNRYRWYNAFLDVDKLDKLKCFGDFEIKDRGTVYFHITETRKLAQVCNKMLLEYLFWCMENKKYAGSHLILPSKSSWNFKWSLMPPSPEAQVMGEVAALKYEEAKRKIEEERNKKYEDIINSYGAGQLALKCEFKTNITSEWVEFTITINDKYVRKGDLFSGGRIYIRLDPFIQTDIGMEIFAEIFKAFFDEYQVFKKTKDGKRFAKPEDIYDLKVGDCLYTGEPTTFDDLNRISERDMDSYGVHWNKDTFDICLTSREVLYTIKVRNGEVLIQDIKKARSLG